MPVVRAPDGSLRVEAGGLSLPWTLGEDRGREFGLMPPMQARGLDPAATAFNDGAGGVGNVPDVPREVPGAGGATNQPAPSGEGGTQGAPAEPAMAPKPPEPKREAPKARALRGGGAVSDNLPDAPGDDSERAPARPSVRYVPGKQDVRVGYTKQYGAPKEDLTAFNEANAKAGEARAEQVGATAMGEHAANVALDQMMGQQIARKSQLVSSAEQRIKAARDEYSAAQADIDNERGKIDSLEQAPHRFWASQSTGAKVLSIIAAAAGGALAGMRGGRNEFLDRLQQTIAEDSATYRAKIAARRGAADLRQSRLDKRMAHLDPDTMEREMEADKFALANAMYQRFALRSKNPEIIAKAQADGAQIAAEVAKMRAEVNSKLGDQITARFVDTPGQYVGAPRANEADVKDLAKARQSAGLNEATAESGNVRDLISALPEGELPTADSRNIVSRGARGLVDLIAGAGSATKAFDTPAQQAAVGQLERAKAALLHKLSGAAISPSEMERLARGLNELNSREGLTRYNAELDRMLERKEAGVKAGYKPEVVEEYERRQRSREPAQRGNRRAE